MHDLILASSSKIRLQLLRSAGLDVAVHPARIDEKSLRDALVADGSGPRDVADTLAEHKALKIANRFPEARILGCDQLLVIDGEILEKPTSPQDARQQLIHMRGRTHVLVSAAVLYDQREPVWRQVNEARLTMRNFSDEFLNRYITENWEEIRHCVGCYQVEGPGVRLFSQIQGDWFTILGLPLLGLLAFLTDRGDIPG